MSVKEQEPQPGQARAGRWARFGVWLDDWTPRFLKVLGLGGLAVSIALFPFGLFNPVMFGGCLTMASGGFVKDALNVLKPGRE